MSFEYFDIRPWFLKFHALSKEYPGDIPLSVTIGDKNAETHFVMGAAIHGNEVAAIPAFVQAIENLKNAKLQSRITFFIGNEEAILANSRFVEYDLNRLFVAGPVISKEHQRAKEIMSLLDTTDYFIDFHQTIQPTKDSFYIFMNDPWSYYFAQFLEGAEVCVIEPPMSNGQMSAEHYVQNRGQAGVTLEIGQIDLTDKNIDKILKVIERVCLLALYTKALPQEKLSNMVRHYKALKKMQIIHQVKFCEAKDTLFEGWKNLDFIQAGSTLGQRANGESIIASHDSYIFFPKYPQRDALGRSIGPLPNNLCEMAIALPETSLAVNFASINEFTMRLSKSMQWL